jgi:hypothetical protein
MQTLQVDLSVRKQVHQFLDLPFKIYRHTSQWVPPLEMDARLMLNPKRHPFYHHSEAAFFMVLKDDNTPAGRIAVINNRNYNAYNHEKTAFFYLFECMEDKEVSHRLFQAAFGWAKQQGLEKIIGPKGFTTLDGMGLLVRGFEHRPAFGQPYNLPYYSRLIEKEGFTSIEEVVSGYLDAQTIHFPDKIHQMSSLIQERKGLHIARFKTRRDIRRIIPHLQEMYNDSLTDTTGNVPLTDNEVKSMADQLLWFADPRLIKIIMKEDQPIGFLFGYPDISAALQRTKGKLFPFGWLILLMEFRRTKWMNINGAGILPKYRGLGGTAILFSEMYKSVIESPYRFADLVQIGLENNKMLRELRDLGINFYKAHRLYERELLT